MKPKTWVEISKNSLIHNLKNFKNLVGEKVTIMCVVKANAYGHGLTDVVKILDNEASFYAVDNADEGLKIRNLGITKPVLILGYTRLDNIKEAVENGLSLTIYSKEAINKIINLKLNKITNIHLKVETGLGRQGLKDEELMNLATLIKNHNTIHLEGLSTHFANIEDTVDSSYAELQFLRFENCIKLLNQNGIFPKLCHASASAGTMLYSNYRLNAVRVGISLYGLWPSEQTKKQIEKQYGKENFLIKPVLEWKSIIAQIKFVEKGETVGYGRTWKARKRTKIAVIPVGYSDGYSRLLSNNSAVIIKGQIANIIGRVAMNMLMVDITAIPKVDIEEEVVLIGTKGDKNISAEYLAERTNTINYEIVARINPQLPRLII